MLNQIKYKEFYHLPKDKEEYNNHFIKNCLQQSILYKRASSFFSNDVFSFYEDAIRSFVYNKQSQKIKIIISNKIEQKDFDEIKRGYNERFDSDIYLKWKNDFSLLEQDKLSELYYLIKIGVVDIKICFTTDNIGIFHSKFGIFSDLDLNSIAFSGSNNETMNGKEYNVETISVYSSWNDNSRIQNLNSTFDNWWNNESNECYTVDIPKCVYKEVLDHSEKGKIVILNKLNQIIFDIEGNNLMIENYSNKKIDESAFFDNFSRSWEKINDNKFSFSNFKTIKNIEYWEKKIIMVCKDLELEFVKGKKLLEYIENKKINIETRKKLGLLCKSDNYNNELKREFNKFKDSIYKLFHRKPNDLQLRDMFYMVFMKRSANFSVPGSGKTGIALGAYEYLKSINEINKLIVIGPKNCYQSWKDEYKNCFNIEPKIWTKEKGKKIYNSLRTLIEEVDFYFINFDSLKSWSIEFSSFIDDKTMIVIDEYHKAKRINGVWANETKKLAKLASYRVCLTGTPIPNGLIDIYNLIDILFAEEIDYFEEFVDPNNLVNLNNDRLKYFYDLIFPFFVRTTKEMLNVPKAEPDNIVECFASDDEIDLISHIFWSFTNPLTKFIRICQASTNPSSLLKRINYNELMLEDEEIEDKILFDDSPIIDEKGIELVNKCSLKTPTKILKTIELIKNFVDINKSLLVWCCFNSTIDALEVELKKEGISYKIINGNMTNLDERIKIIEEFKNNKFSVLITNPQTLAESVSLHKECHDAIYVDYSYNLVHYLQSKDRIHRLGLTDDIKTNYYFISLQINKNEKIFKNSFDKLILSKLKDKEKLMNEIIEKNNFELFNSISSTLTEEEMKILFDKMIN